ncbi:collagen alpha-1(I) chain-like protein, partial [Dinothrombium tinctorium]
KSLIDVLDDAFDNEKVFVSILGHFNFSIEAIQIPTPRRARQSLYEWETYRRASHNEPKISNAVQTYSSSDQLLQYTNLTAVGSLAYVEDEEALVLRVKNGWRYINLGNIVTKHIPLTTPAYDEIHRLIHNSQTTVTSADYARYSKTIKQSRGLIMAALNNPYSGNIGVKNADFACYKQAHDANIGGTFRAFLGSQLQNIGSIVFIRDNRLPVVNTKGEVLYNSWRELFTGVGIPYSSSLDIYSFDGKSVLRDNTWPMKIVWHGANVSGTRDMDANCREWTSNDLRDFGKASVLSRQGLLGQEKYSCNNSFIVLCIQVTTRN